MLLHYYIAAYTLKIKMLAYSKDQNNITTSYYILLQIYINLLHHPYYKNDKHKTL